MFIGYMKCTASFASVVSFYGSLSRDSEPSSLQVLCRKEGSVVREVSAKFHVKFILLLAMYGMVVYVLVVSL